MNQPDLGLKVAELRQQKALTQERLAELCEVSLRTIQRIESGEVDPRAYTLHCLGAALDFDFGEDNTEHEQVWLAALHLSSILCLLVIPLLLWSWKKKQSYKIDQQGRQVLNFQITMTLVLFAAMFILLVGVPLLFVGMITGLIATNDPAWNVVWLPLTVLAVLDTFAFVLVGAYCLFEGALNTVRSLSDRPIHYALSIPFVKYGQSRSLFDQPLGQADPLEYNSPSVGRSIHFRAEGQPPRLASSQARPRLSGMWRGQDHHLLPVPNDHPAATSVRGAAWCGPGVLKDPPALSEACAGAGLRHRGHGGR